MVHGRGIGSTKVKALPEWLGNCTRLEELCVRARRVVPAPIEHLRGGRRVRL